ncbi:hypothetical protein PG985_016245 [Apiospora marii]|uniref:uncharacterized protein n=1 Tax=Apiospora marii TaxID=335849 RepID=UPI00312EEC4E
MNLSTSTAENSSIYAAATECREAFLPCLTCPALMDMEWAENRLADFNLWANGIGAFAANRASLDERLNRDTDTRGIIVHVIGLIHSCLQQCLNLASNPTSREASVQRPSFDEQPSSKLPLDTLPRSFTPFSDESSDSESVASCTSDSDGNGSTLLSKAMHDVERLMNQLARLSVAIRNAGTKSRFRKADKLFDPEDYSEFRMYLENIIKARPPGQNGVSIDFAKIDMTPIQKRLIEANLRRRNRFAYAMRHSQKLAMVSPKLPKRTFVAPDHFGAKLSPMIPEASTNVGVHETVSITKGLTETNASSIGTLPLLPARVPPSRADMTQITSTAAKLIYPEPPKAKLGLQQFKCPCCCQALPLLYQEMCLTYQSSFTNPKMSRKHLMDDIRPYTCILDDCQSPENLYMLRSDWDMHIQHDHSKSWQCLYCSAPGTIPRLFTTADGLTKHIQDCHADAVSEDQIAAVVVTALRPTPFGVDHCPLCDATGASDSGILFDHIAEHIHSFALQSLPWPDDAQNTKYFSQNDYFGDESGDISQRYNVSSMSERDSEGLPSLKDLSDARQLLPKRKQPGS